MVKLIFTDQYANILFLLNGLVILFFIYSLKRKKSRTMKFGNYETLKKVSGGKVLQSGWILALTRILAVTFLLIGLSSPVLVQEVQGAEEDFIIALDTSSSMFNGDVDPTRFKAAKDITKEFLNELGNSSKAGLVTYSGSIEKELELTSDFNKIKTEIDNAEIGETPGTATGDAIAAGVSILLSSDRNRSVILLTDGTNNVGQSINESADYASRQNISVNPIGIGSSNETEEYGIVSGENASRADFNNLNQTRLQNLANKTGGKAIFVSNRQGLEEAFFNLRETDLETDISNYLILLAGVLLVLDSIIRTTDLEVIP